MSNSKAVRSAARFLIAILAVGLVGGCLGRAARRPMTKEPTVSVYDHATGTEKTMGLEQYIEGVVAGEMTPTWPVEALKAQAILARTFTMERLSRGGTRSLHGTDVCTSPEHFQAYNAAEIGPRVQEAVSQTRGMVMTSGGRYVRAWFHANSGGKTASPAEGLGPETPSAPYLRPVKEPAGVPTLPWSASFTAREVTEAARQIGKDVPGVTSAKIASRGPSGRAVTLDFNGVGVPAAQFRVALGPTRMRSTLLSSVSVRDGRVVMSGKGFGHGVGMSQWGARAMAAAGRKASDIVMHYFRGVQLTRRWR